MKWAIRSGRDQSQTELPLVGGLFFASAGGFRCPHVADDATEEQGDHAAPEGHMDAKLFAHDGQEEGAPKRLMAMVRPTPEPRSSVGNSSAG